MITMRSVEERKKKELLPREERGGRSGLQLALDQENRPPLSGSGGKGGGSPVTQPGKHIRTQEKAMLNREENALAELVGNGLAGTPRERKKKGKGSPERESGGKIA